MQNFYGSGSRSGVSCGSCGTRDISGSNTATRRLPDNSREAQLTALLGASACSSAFGQPSPNTNIAYSPLSVQLGFRLGF